MNLNRIGIQIEIGIEIDPLYSSVSFDSDSDFDLDAPSMGFMDNRIKERGWRD